MRRQRKERGIALAWTALVLIVMIGMVGLSIDWGKLTWNAHQMQNGGDAAALAGAHVVKWDQESARTRAIALAVGNASIDGVAITLDRNVANDPGGELVIGRWIRQDRVFIPTTVAPNAVAVVSRREGQRLDAPLVEMVFGPAFGTPSAHVVRAAIAMSIGTTGAGIICLDGDPNKYRDYGYVSEGGSGLVRDGGCEIDLRGPDDMIGDIQVNSRSVAWPKEALVLVNVSGKIWAGEINVVGGTNPEDGWDVYYGDPTLPFSVNPSSPRIEDPLLSINDFPPDITTMPTRVCPDVAGGVTATIDPGWYPNGINPEGGTIQMNPGVYAVGGGTKASQVTGLNFNGGQLIGTGVMIYVTGDSSNGILDGVVNIGAQANAQLVSRGDAATPKEIDGEPGVVLWQDIRNHNMATVMGGSASKLVGTLYFPDAPLRLGGGVNQMGSQVLAGALHIAGNVTLGVAYDGRNMVKSNRSALVK